MQLLWFKKYEFYKIFFKCSNFITINIKKFKFCIEVAEFKHFVLRKFQIFTLHNFWDIELELNLTLTKSQVFKPF